MSKHDDPDGGDAEDRAELLRRARWHLAKALEHRQTAEDLVAEFLGRDEGGGGDEQAIMNEVAELLARLEAQARSEAEPEMEDDDQYDDWTTEWWHREGRAEFTDHLKRMHALDLKALLKEKEVRNVQALREKMGF